MGIMSFFGYEKRSSHNLTSTLSNPQQWLLELFGNRTAAGQNVTIQNTMGLPALFGAYRIISESIASLPLIVYERKKDGVYPVEGSKLQRLLKIEPNDMMSSHDLKIAEALSLESTGNYFNRIYRRRSGEIDAIIPLHYTDVVVRKHITKPVIYYEVTSPDIVGGKKMQVLDHTEIEHGRANSLDGIMGRSPVLTCFEALGRALAIQKYSSEFYANGAHLTGLLTAPVQLNETQHTQIVEWWKKQTEASKGGTAVLGSDMRYQRLSATPAEAELGNAFNLSDKEINQIMRIPPHMNGDLSRSTNNNIEQQSHDFVMHTLRPRLKAMESEKNRKYWLTDENRAKYFVEFNIDALMRSETEARAKLLQVMVQSGIITINEARKHENLPRIDGGDEPLVMTNMAFLSDLKKLTEAMTNKNNQVKDDEDKN